MQQHFIVALVATAICMTPAMGEARQSSPLSCAFINKGAYNNEGDCMFMDNRHSIVMITPYRKITPTKAAQWIISASTALQIGGENLFNEITVLTSPSGGGEYAVARSSNTATVLQEPVVIKSLIKICKQPDDWSDVVGKDGKPATPHKCRTLK